MSLGGSDGCATRQLWKADGSFSSDKEGWWNAVNELMETSSFRLLQDNVVEECSSRLPAWVTSMVAGDEMLMPWQVKKPKSQKLRHLIGVEVSYYS